MNKLKLAVITETLVIIILVGIIATNYYNKQDKNHCENYINSDGTVCLLSPRVYTGMITPESYLLFNFEPLKKDVQSYINKKNQNISVYVLNIRDGASFGIDEDEQYEPVSLIKLPVAMIILKKVEEGKLSLDTILEIKDSDRDKTSGRLYSQPITSLPVLDLLHYMLSESDNTAYWVLKRQVTDEDLARLTKYLDYYKDVHLNNSRVYDLTPKNTGNLFMSLYLSTFLNSENSEMILLFLTKTTFDIHKHAKLPDNVVVSQKYGYYDLNNKQLLHSCGIMYIQDSRIFYCIMTKNLDWDQASESIGEVVNKIYNFVIESKKLKDSGINI